VKSAGASAAAAAVAKHLHAPVVPGGAIGAGSDLRADRRDFMSAIRMIGVQALEERQFFDLDEKLATLSRRRQAEDPQATKTFEDRIVVGWLYHDNALEGTVLTFQEIKDALEGKPSIDSGLAPMYQEVRDHKAAIDVIKALANKRPKPGFLTIEFIKHLYEVLTPDCKSKDGGYRNIKDHSRLYHHAIARFDKIPEMMRKLCTSLRDTDISVHPVAHAINLHFEIMSIYPWARNSGKMARLLMNLILLSDGYPPVVIPGNERQRYYDSLRGENDRLGDLVTDSLETYCSAAGRYLDELAARR
jgi:Fic family protein